LKSASDKRGFLGVKLSKFVIPLWNTFAHVVGKIAKFPARLLHRASTSQRGRSALISRPVLRQKLLTCFTFAGASVDFDTFFAPHLFFSPTSVAVRRR
jgi:hypothetical protein